MADDVEKGRDSSSSLFSRNGMLVAAPAGLEEPGPWERRSVSRSCMRGVGVESTHQCYLNWPKLQYFRVLLNMDNSGTLISSV